jgi:hypothetical protein
MRMASIPPLPELAILSALTPPGATPCAPSGKLTVVPQPFLIRVSFFLCGCWSSGIYMRMDSNTPLPEFHCCSPTPPKATPCPVSGTGNLCKGSTGSAGPQFQNKVSFFLYGCWTSGMYMRMATIPPLPGLTNCSPNAT